MLASKNGYKAIFFDLDGTLRHTVPLGAEVYRKKVAELGMPISDEKNLEVSKWEHYYWASSPDLREDFKKFAGDDDAFYKNYALTRLAKMGATPEQAERFCLDIFKYFREEHTPENHVPPELFEILPNLRSDGYKLAVLSNRREAFDDILKELNLFEFFDGVMAAGDLGSWKPDPKVFTPLLDKLELSPKETLYIGDNYFADVVGARNAGLAPLLYDPRGIFPEADCARMTSFTELGKFL